MGVYLNSTSAFGLFCEDYSLTYYVDKTEIIRELIPLLELKYRSAGQRKLGSGKSPKYVCITRPRRFGKSVMANMIAAFFGKGVDSSEIFDCLKVSQYPWYREHLNNHNVIHIYFNETPRNCHSYAQYIARIENRLLDDLADAYPNAKITQNDTVWDALTSIYSRYHGEKFIKIPLCTQHLKISLFRAFVEMKRRDSGI